MHINPMKEIKILQICSYRAIKKLKAFFNETKILQIYFHRVIETSSAQWNRAFIGLKSKILLHLDS